jgi:UDP-perosamine 4-acetyltransferase
MVIIGAGGHGKAVADVLNAAAEYEIAGFVDAMLDISSVLGLPILGDDAVLPALRASGMVAAFIALGHNRLRMHMADKVRELDFVLPSAIHPSSVVSLSAQLGAGVFVGPLAVINASARIASLAIVNSAAIVEHDCEVGEAAHIAPGCALAGRVRIGARAFIGVGSTVRPGTTIGSDVVVGAGSVVVTDVPSGTTVFGVPAVERPQT